MAYGKMSSQELLHTARGVRGRMGEPDFVRDIAIGDESAKVKAARADPTQLAAAKGKLVEGFASMFGTAFAPTIDIAKKGGFDVAQQRWERGKALKGQQKEQQRVADIETRLAGRDPLKVQRELNPGLAPAAGTQFERFKASIPKWLGGT